MMKQVAETMHLLHSFGFASANFRGPLCVGPCGKKGGPNAKALENFSPTAGQWAECYKLDGDQINKMVNTFSSIPEDAAVELCQAWGAAPEPPKDHYSHLVEVVKQMRYEAACYLQALAERKQVLQKEAADSPSLIWSISVSLLFSLKDLTPPDLAEQAAKLLDLPVNSPEKICDFVTIVGMCYTLSLLPKTSLARVAAALGVDTSGVTSGSESVYAPMPVLKAIVAQMHPSVPSNWDRYVPRITCQELKGNGCFTITIDNCPAAAASNRLYVCSNAFNIHKIKNWRVQMSYNRENADVLDLFISSEEAPELLACEASLDVDAAKSTGAAGGKKKKGAAKDKKLSCSGSVDDSGSRIRFESFVTKQRLSQQEKMVYSCCVLQSSNAAAATTPTTAAAAAAPANAAKETKAPAAARAAEKAAPQQSAAGGKNAANTASMLETLLAEEAEEKKGKASAKARQRLEKKVKALEQQEQSSRQAIISVESETHSTVAEQHTKTFQKLVSKSKEKDRKQEIVKSMSVTADLQRQLSEAINGLTAARSGLQRANNERNALLKQFQSAEEKIESLENRIEEGHEHQQRQAETVQSNKGRVTELLRRKEELLARSNKRSSARTARQQEIRRLQKVNREDMRRVAPLDAVASSVSQPPRPPTASSSGSGAPGSGAPSPMVPGGASSGSGVTNMPQARTASRMSTAGPSPTSQGVSGGLSGPATPGAAGSGPLGGGPMSGSPSIASPPPLSAGGMGHHTGSSGGFNVEGSSMSSRQSSNMTSPSLSAPPPAAGQSGLFGLTQQPAPQAAAAAIRDFSSFWGNDGGNGGSAPNGNGAGTGSMGTGWSPF